MTRLRAALLAALMVLGLSLFAIACGGDDDDEGGTPATSEDVEMTQGTDLTIAMVTHGDGGSFWSVAKKGAEDGAKAMGVELKYSESNNDPEEQAQLIEAAVTEGVDGIAVSAPNPDAIKGALQTAVDAEIPIVTLNSGAAESAELGAMTHVGQTETIAGEGAGAKLKEAGASKMLCIIHEQGNVGLNERCEGAKSGFGGDVENLQVAGTADVSTTLTEIQSKLESDNSVDAVLALNPDIAMAARDAVAGANSEATVATFDLSGDVVTAIQDGEIAFAVDQQQYLQGYLPVVFLTLNKTNANTVGGGQPVLTGPGFVEQDNAETVAQLAEDGTR
jgi:simple sugar transport system substrate-binding protein